MPVSDLRLGTQVDDAIQFNLFAKLMVQPAMPVLVYGPLRLIYTLTFIQVSGKDVPENRRTRKGLVIKAGNIKSNKAKGKYMFLLSCCTGK